MRRFLVLALSFVVGGGCGSGRTSLEPGGGGGAAGAMGGGGAGGAAIPLARKVDLLFMIDNSSGMSTGQDLLKYSVADFISTLATPAGGLPDMHIAIVTSDMGAGDGTSIMGCSQTGDAGVFRFAPTGPCTSTGLDVGATFLTSTGGSNPLTNFGTQDIATVFECIMTVGSIGCGFEHQLASVARALGADGSAPPPENAGFLRPDALLAIVLVTNEDDCSGPPGDPLFDPASSKLASMYGPTENFQCNEWGHLCVSPTTGQLVQPSRYAPNDSANDTVTYSAPGGPNNCQSFEASPVLSSVGRLAGGIKGLKTDPDNQIVVAAFAGPPFEYTVKWQTAPTPDTGPWPYINRSCGGDATITIADPAVRINEFVRSFGANGLFNTFCQSSYVAPLEAFAARINQLIGS